MPLDISNAFVRASMGDIRACARLPEIYRDDGGADDGKRILQKALYGLPISPRLWAKTLARDLEGLGWRECKAEPGVWVLREDEVVTGYLTVYVDDCVLGCRTKEIAEREFRKISDKHPASIIATKTGSSGTMRFDLCGADVELNPRERTFRMSMGSYVDKMLARFDMVNAKPRASPDFPEEKLYRPAAGSDEAATSRHLSHRKRCKLTTSESKRGGVAPPVAPAAPLRAERGGTSYAT